MEHGSCYRWLRFFFFAEDAQETFTFRLAWFFFRTLPGYDGNNVGYAPVECPLAQMYFGKLIQPGFLVRQHHTECVYFRALGLEYVAESMQSAVYHQPLHVILCHIVLIPFCDGFPLKGQSGNLHVQAVNVLPQFIYTLVPFLLKFQRALFVVACVSHQQSHEEYGQIAGGQ